MEYYSPVENNEILTFVMMWINLRIIILSKVSQTNTNMYIFIYM